ncbi:MAG: hypothetical protein ABW321_18510 [Polyangiales bacterium]
MCLPLMAACTKTGGRETLIGETCDTADDCDVAGLCLTDGPDGLCSADCIRPGEPGQCPLGTYCDRAELTAEGDDPAVLTVCLPACERHEDCRDGYSCNGVSSGPGKVCHPER